MPYEKNNYYMNQEMLLMKNNLIMNMNYPKDNIMVPAVMPSKFKKEYLYTAGIAVVLITLMNDKELFCFYHCII